MLFGMGTVFVFLTILVFATGLMSKVVTWLESEETPESTDATMRPPVATVVNSMPSKAQIRAIEKAIAAHRQR